MRPGKPRTLNNFDIDHENLVYIIKDYIDFLWRPHDLNLFVETEADFEDRIVHEAIEMVYGPKIWDKIKEVQK